MKTSLRLAVSAVAISFITLAASGKPLPFLTSAHTAAPPAAFNPFDHQQRSTASAFGD